MKKSILFGYTALCALGVITSAHAETVPVVPTVETVKNAFHEFLKNQGLTLNKEVLVKEDGENFTITVPSFETQVVDQTTLETTENGKSIQTETLESVTRIIPERTVQLVRNGSFANHAQYKMEPATLEQLQAILKDFLPMLTLSADQFKSELIWVPAYNLISRQSLNTQKLKAIIPGQVELNADSMVFDMLARPTQNNKMDTATSNDIKGMSLKLLGMTALFPTISQSIQWINSDISGDGIMRNLTADEISANIKIPMVSIIPDGDTQPIVTFSAEGKSQIDKDFHFLVDVKQIQLTDNLPIPSIFSPTDIRVNMTVSGLDRKQLLKIQQETQLDNSNQQNKYDEDVLNLIKDATIVLNPLEIKNEDAGISVTGTAQNYVTTEGELDQKINATVTITNLDKISPEPKVDEEECATIKKQLSEANTPPEMAAQFIESACRPKGGLLDEWRIYLDPQKRVVNPDGTTTDVLEIQYQGDTLIINGKNVNDSLEGE